MKQKYGFCLYMTAEDFFTEYVKNNSLDRTQILIVSRDFVGDIKEKQKYNTITYQSRYDNIDFVPSLLPNPASLEFAYSDSKERFHDAYEGHLLGDDAFSDLICIVDMVVNDGVNIILLSSRAEFKSTFPYFIKDFVLDKFGMKICLAEELEEAESEEEYNRIITDIRDVEEIRTLLDFHKRELTEDKTSSEEFFNQFMEDAPVKYRKVLMTKDIPYLISMANEKGLHVSRRKSKEFIVDAIVKEVFGSDA